jgi:hypothetical protein
MTHQILSALSATVSALAYDRAGMLVQPRVMGSAARPSQPQPLRVAEIVGSWSSEDGSVELSLLPDGRYHEIRRRIGSQYAGRYRTVGSQLLLDDDSGFSVSGELLDGTLILANDRLRRSA